MACQEDNERLSLYIDGLLPAEEAHRVAAHLATCAECTHTVMLYRLIPTALDVRRHVPPPPDFTKVVMQRIALLELNISSSTSQARLEMTQVSIQTIERDDDDDEMPGGLVSGTPHLRENIPAAKPFDVGRLFGLVPNESLVRGTAPVFGKAALLPPTITHVTPQQARHATLAYALRFSGVAAALVLFVGVIGAEQSTGSSDTASSRTILDVMRVAAVDFSSPLIVLSVVALVGIALSGIALYSTRHTHSTTR